MKQTLCRNCHQQWKFDPEKVALRKGKSRRNSSAFDLTKLQIEAWAADLVRKNAQWTDEGETFKVLACHFVLMNLKDTREERPVLVGYYASVAHEEIDRFSSMSAADLAREVDSGGSDVEFSAMTEIQRWVAGIGVTSRRQVILL